MGSWCTIGETLTTFTNELDLKATNSLSSWVFYYASKRKKKKNMSLN
jgi:hypothetical protein